MKTKITSSPLSFGRPSSELAAGILPGMRVLIRRLLGLLLIALFLGSSALPASLARDGYFSMTVAGHSWDLFGWEVKALSEKVAAAFAQPADTLMTAAAASEEVKDYMARAGRIGEIEGDLARRAVQNAVDYGDIVEQGLMVVLADLRTLQEKSRVQVEQVIERQVSNELALNQFDGLGVRVWPPVSFGFVEPPKKLVISARDRIETIFSRMLEAEISLSEIEAAEAQIRQQENAVGYVTDIGGLGAFPTLVVDRASLSWVLSTVAHEWAHNYLVFFPLGWNYFASQDMTTLNESVAEIVGNEIGTETLKRYYPELVPPPNLEEASEQLEEPAFDFQVEMQITRQEVDRLLAKGDVAGAEEYMEARRQLFVEQGYPLRVLNQAYFAFHGSYGTSPASTSPIGPKLERLRALMPDLKSFLTTVRAFTSVEDLDRALAEWEATGVSS